MNANETKSVISILGSVAVLAMLCFAPGISAQTITAGSSPNAVAINPVTNKIYVANAGGTVTVIDGATNATITVTAGSGPDSIAVNPITNKIYVANNLAGTVTVIDGVTLTTATVVVGSSPAAVAINPVTNKIYVANAGSNNITVIDGITNFTTIITVGSGPDAVAVNPLTNKIYVANAGSSSVTAVDGVTNATSTFLVGSNPKAVAVNSVTNRIYVASADSGNVTVIDATANNTATIVSASGSNAVAVNPVTNKIYVANSSGTVTVIDGATGTTTSVAADTGAGAVAVNSMTNRIYVANDNGTTGTLTTIDGATNAVNTVPAGNGSDAVAVNPVTDKIYVANSSGTVTVFDGSTNVTGLLPTSGLAPTAVAINPVTDKIYVANFGANDVSEIDSLTNTTVHIPVGGSPVSIAVNPVTNKIYAAIFDTNGSVAVIDGLTHSTSTVPAGVFAFAIAINTVTDKIYVTSARGFDVTVIDGATNAAISVPTGEHPQSLAVNPVTNTIYVANLDGTVTAIDGATNTTTTIPVDFGPDAVAVNTVTNRIYVANEGANDVTVIDGASNTVIGTVAVGNIPIALAVNLITNKIYAGNSGDGTLTVIDGATNATTTIAAGFTAFAVNQISNKIYLVSGKNAIVIDGLTNATTTVATNINPFHAIAINPVSNQIYIFNNVDQNVVVLAEAQTQSVPLVTAITPLVNNQTTSPTPTFSFGVTSNYQPFAPAPLAVYFQVDTWQGTWTQASGANPTYSGTTGALTAGFHVLYAYASDGQDSGANGDGISSQIAIGQIAAYPFTVMSGSAPVVSVTVDASNLDFGSQGLQIPSQPMIVTVTSTGSAAVSFGASTLTGANAGDFAIAADGCAGALLSNGGTCQVSVTFAPTVLGARTANLQINLDQPGTAPIVALTGSGAAAPPKTPSSTTFSTSPNPSVFSQDVTLTAIVAASAGSPHSPQGTVTFLDGSDILGTAVLDSSLQATLDISSLTAGTHSITASYSGNPSFTASVSPALAQTVTSTKTPTTTTLTSSANPATYAQSIILTATVSSTTTGMTGVVTFSDGGTTLGQAQVSGGTATIAVNALAARTFGISAVYGGDNIFATSTSPQTIQTVNKGATTCSISLVDADNPSATHPQPFDDANIDVLVSSQNTLGQITGTTNVFDNNIQLPQGFLSNASSVFGLSQFTPGSHTYLGVYSGDTNNTPAQCTFVFSLPKVGTVTTLASSLNPANAGQSVVFSAHVSLFLGHAPTGSVTLSDNGTSLALVPLDAQGAASFTTASLTAGPHSITAIYGGDQSFTGSVSSVLTQTILASTVGGPGVCSCGLTGAYVDPAKAVDLDKTGDPLKSSQNKYSVTVSIDNANQITSLTVTRNSDKKVMFSSSTLPITTHWGFSPDEDRFLYHSVAPNTNIDEIIVLDLSVTPAREVVNFSSTNTSDRLQFSPSGSYFLFTATVGQNMGEVKIFRVSGVAAPTLVHDDTYTFQTVPGDGEDSFGGVGWGFGPGKPETSFVYAYGNGPTNFSLNLVNLATGQVIPGKTIAAFSSFWQYNPCSDVLGLVTQPFADKEGIDLYLTRDGSTLFPASTFPLVGLTALSSDGTSEKVKFDLDPPVILAPSPSCGPNTPVGPNVVANPKDPATGQSPIAVTFSNVTQSGQTSVTSSTTGTPPPAGFELGNPPVFYDVATTATFSGQITICISYAGITFPNNTPQLFHFVNGAWVNQTITIDTNSKMICAAVTSLSPFAIFESVQTALTVTANNASQVYGAAPPAFGVSYSGFVNGDTAASLSGTLVCASAATQASPIGHYPITCSGQSSATYVVNYVPGTLTIGTAPLTVTANSTSRPYGASNPVLTGTIAGVQNGDPITASFTTAAGPANVVGAYPITPIVHDPSNLLSNYSVKLVNGTLSVVPERTTLKITLSPSSILIGKTSTATVTITAPDMVIPIDPSVLASITLLSPIVSDILTSNGVCNPVPSSSPGVASCTFTVTSVEPGARTLNANFTGSTDLLASGATTGLTVTAALETRRSCISSDFRNVPVSGGSYLWFNSVFKVSEVTKKKITITFFQSSVQFQYTDAKHKVVMVNQPMPDAKIVIDPSVTTASTIFDAVDNVWITTIPFDLDDAAFLTGMPWLVPAGGIPADIEPVTWCGTFASDTVGLDVEWRWAAAAYSSFSSDNNALGVKPMHTDRDNPGTNHDRAGTPENFKKFVIPGGRGKGGTNFTGTCNDRPIIE